MATSVAGFGLGLAEGGLYAVPPPDTRLRRADLGRDPIPRFAEAADPHRACCGEAA